MYCYSIHELGDLGQSIADLTADNFPKKPAPDGFAWVPIIKMETDEEKFHFCLTWVAKPHGS
jgi:hypothetical protein